MPTADPFKPLAIGRSYQVRFTPDGQSLAVVGDKLTLWNLQAGKRVGAYRPFAHPSDLDVAPSGALGVVKNTGGRLATFPLSDPAAFVQLPVKDAVEGCEVLFSPCGLYVVDGSWDGRLSVHEIATGRCVFMEEFDDCMLERLACDAARELFVYYRQPLSEEDAEGVVAGSLVLRRWPFDKHGETCLPGRWRRVDAVAPSPDGRRLAILHEARLSVVALDGGEPVVSCALGETAAGIGLAWSPDGAIVACTERRQASFFDAATLARRARHVVAHASDVAFSPDGRLAAVGSWEKGVVLGVAQLTPWSAGDAYAAGD